MAGLMKKKKSREAEIPTASMADIAFLLLIFFLVTTTIDVDTGIGMVLPPPLDENVDPPVHRSTLVGVVRGDWRALSAAEDLGSLVPGLTFVPASQNPGQLAISV